MKVRKPRLTAAQRLAIQQCTSLVSTNVPHRVMCQIVRRGLVVLSHRGSATCPAPRWVLTDAGRWALEPSRTK